MNKFSGILSLLALLGVIILGILHFTAGKSKTNRQPKVVTSTEAGKTVVAGSRCAHVDIDSLQSRYNLYKSKKTEFERKSKTVEDEIERSSTSFRAEVEAFQRKVQEGKFTTQEQGEAEQQRLARREQELTAAAQAKQAAFMKEQDAFNKELRDIRGMLKEYAEDNGYDYIFLYSSDVADEVVYANAANDITDDVVDALNSGKSFAKASSKTTTTDSTKKTSK